jgi:hypothetical protein
MKLNIVILLFLTNLWSEIYLLPDDSNLLLYHLKRDLRDVKSIQISTTSIDYKKIFNLIRKANNGGAKIKFLTSKSEIKSSTSLIRQLATLKNIEIKVLNSLQGGDIATNFIVVDGRLGYILPYDLKRDNFSKVYGVAIKLENEESLNSLKRVFSTIFKRADLIF